MNYNTSDIIEFNTDVLNISNLTKFDTNISQTIVTQQYLMQIH